MGVSKQQAAENRRAIIAAAETLFRERGVDGVGLAELMKAAGFTQGGFYNHFKSKDDLVRAVLDEAMHAGADALETAVAQSAAMGANPLTRQIDWYLSEGHRADLDAGCPLSGFVGDVRRLDDGARQTFTAGLDWNLKRFTELVRTPQMTDEAARQTAVALFSEMVGALLLARAVVQTDPVLSDEILARGRAHLHATVRAWSRRRHAESHR